MAKYLGTDGKKHSVNLLAEAWENHGCVHDNILYVSSDKSIPELFRFDKDLDEDNVPISGYLEIGYEYAEEDILEFFPIMTYVGYEKGFNCEEVYMELSDSEKAYFQGLLTDMIGDKHTPEMQKVMQNYNLSVDKELYYAVKDVVEGRDILPVTVGYLAETTRQSIIGKISDVTELWFSPRVVIDADAIRHIIKRHGSEGKADHSMSDIDDIARLPYVLANYDDVEFAGTYSKKYKCKDGSPAPHICFSKRIDGTYYMISAVSDAKANKSYVVSAFIGESVDCSKD